MKPKKIPQRLCVGCQEMKNKKELMRVVRTPAGEVLLDPTGKKAGRGAYVCSCEACLNKAFKEKKLERALNQVIAPEVYEQLRQGIIKI
ncbi:Hypothetical protein LUCI_3315 [Lucifera butyrica]|uniref:YlxR domain-containing protein n=1 Tax=Lucifera butyrica TaxID=1351585 RepID=A0A498RAQ3_9FIRM|nr:YlxR family protein [Lucifera butyrica]VBB08050.1 Hypothetical protein LUCI_3315 [Lucifera butyrica]